MILKFTNEMVLPENLASLINDSASNKLLEVVMINGDTQEIDSNLLQWTVTEASSSKINIRLTFEQPLLVSQGDAADILLI